MAFNDKNDIFTEMGDDDMLWLKELIDKDFEQFELPESLRSENLIHKLDGIEQDAPKAKPAGKVVYLKFLSAAACFALVILGWSHFGSLGDSILQKNDTETAIVSSAAAKAQAPMLAAAPAAMAPAAAEPAAYAAETAEQEVEEAAIEDAAAIEDETEELVIPEQPTAKSYDEIYSVLSDMAAAEPMESNIVYSTGGIMLAAPKANPSAGGGVNSVAEDAVDMGGVYGTNTQVAGIDESDIVKTNGKYIYHYRFDSKTGGAQIKITAVDGLKAVSTIELPDYSDAEMYISGNRLIAVQNMSRAAVDAIAESLTEPLSDYLSGKKDESIIVPEYEKRLSRRRMTFTEAIVFDITDKAAPKELKRYQQDGSYVSSRMSGDMLYLVSNKSVYSDISPAVPARFYLPYAGNQNAVKPISAENILLPSYRENFNYAVVTSMNVLSGKTDTKAVLGMADEIMMSKNNLYLAATVYDGQRGYRDRATGVSRFAVTDDGLKYIADAKIAGYIDNQFSLDEHQGNLRIATTSYSDSGETVNNLYLLDSTMKQIGAVENLAPGERIYSVRFMGDTAYVVTFKETDPLFVIDLSDPTKPVVKGELKIPGFSEYLHPIDENTLIGLGNNTMTTKYGSVITDGLKLSLFDVSDPLDPREKYNCLIGNRGSDSPALQNHKAFMYYAEKGIFGFPATVYTTYGAAADEPYSGESRLSFGGYLVIKPAADRFEIIGTIPAADSNGKNSFMHNDSGSAIERGIYIGETLYTVSSSGISAYSLNDFSQKAKLNY